MKLWSVNLDRFFNLETESREGGSDQKNLDAKIEGYFERFREVNQSRPGPEGINGRVVALCCNRRRD
jgi:hypothetical protein